MRSKDIVLSIVCGLIIAIIAFVISAYMPTSSPGLAMNLFRAIVWGIMGVLLTITLTKLKKE